MAKADQLANTIAFLTQESMVKIKEHIRLLGVSREGLCVIANMAKEAQEKPSRQHWNESSLSACHKRRSTDSPLFQSDAGTQAWEQDPTTLNTLKGLKTYGKPSTPLNLPRSAPLT
jgi:hypothetical protein